MPEGRLADAVDAPHVRLRTQAGCIPDHRPVSWRPPHTPTGSDAPHVDRGLPQELQARGPLAPEEVRGGPDGEEERERVRRGVEGEVEGDALREREHARGGEIEPHGDAVGTAPGLRLNRRVVTDPFGGGPEAMPGEG